jgi:hypothetical protein
MDHYEVLIFIYAISIFPDVVLYSHGVFPDVGLDGKYEEVS